MSVILMNVEMAFCRRRSRQGALCKVKALNSTQTQITEFTSTERRLGTL